MSDGKDFGKLVPPCKGCTKKYIGCHSDCKDYLEYKEATAKLKEKIRLSKEAYSVHVEICKDAQAKRIKNKRTKRR